MYTCFNYVTVCVCMACVYVTCVCILRMLLVQLVEAVHNVKELVEQQRRPPTPEEEGIIKCGTVNVLMYVCRNNLTVHYLKSQALISYHCSINHVIMISRLSHVDRNSSLAMHTI